MRIGADYQPLFWCLRRSPELLRIATYKDIPGEDFIIIYPYLWTDNPETCVDAYITLTTGNSQMINEIPAEVITEANQMLGTALDAFRKSYNEDDL